MRSVKKHKRMFVIGSTLVLILGMASVLLMSRETYAECTGGCCQANCDLNCCTGSMSCGPEGCKYCENCCCTTGGTAACGCGVICR